MNAEVSAMHPTTYASPTPAAIQELLDGDGHFTPAHALLSDLSEEQATARAPGAPYTIAQILAHTHFFQQRESAGVRGEPQTPYDDLESTFAPPPPGAWPRLVADFLAGTDELKGLAADPAVIHHPSRANPDTETGYDIAGLSVHNAYHLGHITLLRRMLGAWPPAGRDDW